MAGRPFGWTNVDVRPELEPLALWRATKNSCRLRKAVQTGPMPLRKERYVRVELGTARCRQLNSGILGFYPAGKHAAFFCTLQRHHLENVALVSSEACNSKPSI